MIDTKESDESILREVKLGNSILDFKVGNIYIEVKTPLMMVGVKYGKNIKRDQNHQIHQRKDFLNILKNLRNRSKKKKELFY